MPRISHSIMQSVAHATDKATEAAKALKSKTREKLDSIGGLASRSTGEASSPAPRTRTRLPKFGGSESMPPLNAPSAQANHALAPQDPTPVFGPQQQPLPHEPWPPIPACTQVGNVAELMGEIAKHLPRSSLPAFALVSRTAAGEAGRVLKAYEPALEAFKVFKAVSTLPPAKAQQMRGTMLSALDLTDAPGQAKVPDVDVLDKFIDTIERMRDSGRTVRRDEQHQALALLRDIAKTPGDFGFELTRANRETLAAKACDLVWKLSPQGHHGSLPVKAMDTALDAVDSSRGPNNPLHFQAVSVLTTGPALVVASPLIVARGVARSQKNTNMAISLACNFLDGLPSASLVGVLSDDMSAKVRDVVCRAPTDKGRHLHRLRAAHDRLASTAQIDAMAHDIEQSGRKEMLARHTRTVVGNLARDAARALRRS